MLPIDSLEEFVPHQIHQLLFDCELEEVFFHALCSKIPEGRRDIAVSRLLRRKLGAKLDSFHIFTIAFSYPIPRVQDEANITPFCQRLW